MTDSGGREGPERNECVSRKGRPLISLKEKHSNTKRHTNTHTHMNAVKIRFLTLA